MDYARLTEFLTAYPALYDIPFAALKIHRGGKEIYRYEYGFLDEAKTTPISGDERYYMYSCSKIVTCVAALTLLEKGKYHLDDAVSLYLPEFKNMKVKIADGTEEARSQISIRDLFTMTSGMDYDYNAEEIKAALKENPNASTAEIIRAIAKRPLVAHPREKFNYGFSHDVLARLIEVLSGVRFSDYVEETIFKPLGMEYSTFKSREVKDKIAPLYRYNYATRRSERYHGGNWYIFSDDYESGGAGMVSTIDDYLKFLDGLKGGKLISKYTLKSMLANQLGEAQLAESRNCWVFRGFGYGLGVRVHNDKRTSDNNAPLGIFGWSGAAGAMPIVDLKNDLTIMYVQHMLYDDQGEFESRLLNVIYSCLGEEVEL